MTMSRRGHAVWAAFLWPAGHHHAAWRLPDSRSDEVHSLDMYLEMARTAERGKLDVVFLGDLLAMWPLPRDLLARTSRAARFEPITVLGAMAAVTERIGLVATASTSFNEPFTIARQFGSLDHMSGGRTGWNVVTSFTDDQARNYGLDKLPERKVRYAQAQEFLDVVKGLWDSYDDDAVLRDKESGQYFDPAKLHALEHDGDHYRVAGPLNMWRPPQGHPVVFQAGASDEGAAFAAANGEVLFTVAPSIERARQYYRKVKDLAADMGRDPDHIKVLASLNPVLGPTDAAAQERFDQLQSLLDGDVATALAGHYFGIDLTKYPLDEPVPEIELVDSGHSMPRAHQQFMLNKSRDEGLTMRQLVTGFCGLGLYPAGPESAADRFEEWFEAEACDGFVLQFSHLPEGLTDFVDLVVPILQQRGLLRTEYRGRTLREHLGLPRPASRYTPVEARR